MIVNTLNSTTGVPGCGDWVGLCGIVEDRLSQIPQFLKAVQALVSLDRVLVEVGRHCRREQLNLSSRCLRPPRQELKYLAPHCSALSGKVLNFTDLRKLNVGFKISFQTYTPLWRTEANIRLFKVWCT